MSSFEGRDYADPDSSFSEEEISPTDSLVSLDSVENDQKHYHLSLLQLDDNDASHDDMNGSPLFTTLAARTARSHSSEKFFSQHALLAGIVDEDTAQRIGVNLKDPRLFFNVAVPSSAFICGSQGSGKSHTLSCLLENCLMPNAQLGALPKPLAALVFHWDTFTSDHSGSPCEAAFLSSDPDVKIRVLCSPSNLTNIKRIYEKLPRVTVEPLRVSQDHLNAGRMLELMAATPENGTPLYMHALQKILRDMRLEQQLSGATGFDYRDFKTRVDAAQFTPQQRSPLDLRLDLLESFLPPRQISLLKNKRSQKVKAYDLNGTSWSAEPGSLTIVDLSCPFVSDESACMLFNICLNIFLEQKTETGRVVALDEAHKFMTATDAATTFTNTLLSTIRLQRHEGVRIFVATQEPTISPKFLDLCSVTLVHRFSSPEWLSALRQHLAAATATVVARAAAVDDDDGAAEAPADRVAAIFRKIVALRRGDALLFAPSALLARADGAVLRLGSAYLTVRVRGRVSSDGGKSVMAE